MARNPADRARLETEIADCIRASVEVQTRLLEPEHVSAIATAADVIAAALAAGHKLLLFGNGGSAADATHIAAEFVGRFLHERDPLPALSLSDNASSVTAIGNDYAYAEVFSRQVTAFGVPGDVAIAFTTSGSSANVLAGVRAAADAGMATIGLTGARGAQLAELVDVCIMVPSEATPRIQEGHGLVGHVLCELVERRLVEGG